MGIGIETKANTQETQLLQGKNMPILGTANVVIGGGGYVTGIYLHPLEQDLIYIKTDVGGFYKWNGSLSWIPLTEHFPMNQSHYYGGEALALDPNNSNVVYIACGKYSADWEPNKGSIFKSIDKGASWTKMNIDLKMGGNEDQRWTGERLAVDPFNSNILFFGSRRDGLWKSSDAGNSWQKVNSFTAALTDYIGITAVAFNKYQFNAVYAIAYGDGVYVSNNNGASWAKMSGSPQYANRIIIQNSNTICVTHRFGISKWSGGAWTNITPFGQSAEFNAISLNPQNSQDILTASFLFNVGIKIYRSTDGGNSWSEKTRTVNSSVPWWSDFLKSNAGLASLEFDPKIAGRVWLTDWYGIFRTDNINAQPSVWTNYEKGHEEVVVFSLSSPPLGPHLLSGVADVDGFNHQHNFGFYPSGFNKFQDTYSIDYCYSFAQNIVRVCGNRFDDTYYGQISSDNGSTWRSLSLPSGIVPIRVAVSPQNKNNFVILTSGGPTYRTQDGGSSWQQSTGLPNGFNGPWDFKQPLAADRNEAYFYYYDSGKFYLSNNGGLSFWITNTSLPNSYWCNVKTPPGTEEGQKIGGEAWIALDGDGLYYTLDIGTNFTRIQSVTKAYLIALGKRSAGNSIATLFLYGDVNGMGSGIFRSTDRGQSWIKIGDPSKPIGNSPTFMEASKTEFGLVFVGTNGRGIYYGS